MKIIIKNSNGQPFTAFEADVGEQVIIPFNTKEVSINLAYLKPDGAVNDEPSFILVMQDTERNRFLTQISLKTLMPLIQRALELEKENEKKMGNTNL